MNRYSVNGTLEPTDGAEINNEYNYNGHFLKVSYIQLISGNPVYSKDRINVEDSGDFRFYLPKADLVESERIKVDVYAPNGGLIGSQNYSYGSLKASYLAGSEDDDSDPLVISVDPDIIEFNEDSPAGAVDKRISGKLIDISGEHSGDNLQVVIMATQDASALPGSEEFFPVMRAITSGYGSFRGKVPNNKNFQKAYAVVTGLEEQYITIALESKKFPDEIILVTDLSNIPEDAVNFSPLSNLPDSDELVNSGAYSQDIGGKCVDFTVPNRTLEEFSFYQTVRTTEPEIKGLTITQKDTNKFKDLFLGISDSIFDIFSRLNKSFTTMSVVQYEIEEEQPLQQTLSLAGDNKNEVAVARSLGTNINAASLIAAPSYSLKLASEFQVNAKIRPKDLSNFDKGLNFVDLLKLLAEQARRKKKLNELHQKLAAAYCGKNGVQEEKTFCESLALEDNLNRNTIRSLMGHIETYTAFVKKELGDSGSFNLFITEAKEALDQEYISATALDLLESKSRSVIKSIDLGTAETQDQEELLGYLRRIAKELHHAKDGQLAGFEPCPPEPKEDSMGVMCLIRMFEETRNTIRNKAIFTLAEIITIRSNYDIFITSISTFLNLLDEFHSFYKSSNKLFLFLEDRYFIDNYSEIKSNLVSLKQRIYRAIRLIERIQQEYILNHPGRRELTVENEVDWDDTPTVYENTTIAHGHILHFKQKWKADGYSLGDLLYSLPLAPCQEKQIAILDWDRAERSIRTEAQTVVEELEANISRERDITEIMNSALNERSRARSTNKTDSTSGGFGAAIGGFFGVAFGIGGGVSHSGASSTSTASQTSSRNLSASALNSMQDTVSQSASSLRSQRNTVIQTVGQNETVMAQTEVIKNNNHCHAMTVEYFEVLKHYALEQELVDVQECLFVPLPMSHFDHAKVLRWKDTLRRSIYGRKLRRGFDAIERMENNYADSDFPVGTYGEENIEIFNGYFTISFEFKRPFIFELDAATTKEVYNLNDFFPWYMGFMNIPIVVERPLTDEEKDALFEDSYAGDIAREFINTLQIDSIDDSGNEVMLDLDVTLLSNYRKGRPLKVNVTSRASQTITREQIKYLRFRANTNVNPSSRIILRSAYISYRTQHLNEYIVRNSRVNNDIINSVEIDIFPPSIEITTVTDAALIYTPMNYREKRNPRKEDREAAASLISFLNEHMEQSHKIIWSRLDSSRLFGLLDGYIAPNSTGRSVASVVDNKVMGVVGNNLVLKVVPGERLDPVFKGVDDLLNYYKPTTAPDPFRISVPTKGVYAESVMGKCNSCEEIDDSRHWRFDDEPCGTKPTSISELSTNTRRADPGNLQPKDLPANLINMQTAPAAPAPGSLSDAINAVTKADVFRDITGLAGTQQNAIKALETTSKSVTDLAGIAADVQKQAAMKKDIGKTLKTIKKAKDEKQISDDEAKKLSYSALKSMVGEPTKKPAKLTEQKEVKKLIDAETKKQKANIKINSGTESIEVRPSKTGGGTWSSYTVPGLIPLVPQPTGDTCWAAVATMLYSWNDKASYPIEHVMDEAGAQFRAIFDHATNKGLPVNKNDEFATALGFEVAPPMSYSVDGFKNLIEVHGALIVIGDANLSDNWLHARVVRGIYGDGTVDGTFLEINDPWPPGNGAQYNESFNIFMTKYENAANQAVVQIMHY